MDSRSTSTERQGLLASFTFKGQCYSTGFHSKAKCTLCGRDITRVYILKDPENRSVPTGSECFSKFKTNPKLHKALRAAQVWLRTTLEAEAQDKRLTRLNVWRRRKTEALRKIQFYEKQVRVLQEKISSIE